MDSETVRFIRTEIERQLNIILPGITGSTTTALTEDIDSMYPGMPTIPARPTVKPYGLASRPPTGTASVIARMGSDPGNRIVLGHRDKDAPDYLDSGETVLYNQFGQQIYLKNGEIRIGGPDAQKPFVLGDLTNEVLKSLIGLLVAHTHPSPGAPPTNSAAFNQLKAQNLDNGAILSEEVFGQ